MIILYPFVMALYAGYVLLAVPASIACGAAAYSALLPGQVVRALALVLAIRPDNLAPSRRPIQPPRQEEPARLTYFYGQAVADRVQVGEIAIAGGRDAWGNGAEHVRRAVTAPRGDRWFTAPLGVGYAVGMTVGYLPGSALALAVWQIYLAVVAAVMLMVRTWARVLRGIDTLALRLRHIRMVCPACYERVPYPAYRCRHPGCGRVHHDIRPGAYGLIRRTCECGTVLPTLLLFGTATALDAVCPHSGCARPLEHRPGEAPEVVLPLFGATGAGKTRLLLGLVTGLRDLAEQPGRWVEFADSDTGRRLNDAVDRLSRGNVVATVTGLPKGYTLRMGAGGRRWLMHLFDAAGERFYRSDKAQELRYFANAQTFVLVINPLSVERLWSGIPAPRRHQLGGMPPGGPPPELTYQLTQDQIAAMGVDVASARLAVVFSRLDLLTSDELTDSSGAGADEMSGPAVERWAADRLGFGNLIRSARHEFGEVDFFRTAALLSDGHVHNSVQVLLRWILRAEGIALASSEVGAR